MNVVYVLFKLFQLRFDWYVVILLADKINQNLNRLLSKIPILKYKRD